MNLAFSKKIDFFPRFSDFREKAPISSKNDFVTKLIDYLGS